MKIALFGRNYTSVFTQHITELLNLLEQKKVEVVIFKPFYEFIQKQSNRHFSNFTIFEETDDAPSDVNFLVSIGGDGTFLESISYLKRHDIPVIGLNSGRLGFLANISKEEIHEAFNKILEGNYKLENRSLIELISEQNPFGKNNIGLNDITIQKKDTNLLTIEAYVNNEFLNTYWTDGIIVSTPTGSTAYNLAVGGPIIVPGSNNIVIAPIASHNLTVRPVVLPDNVDLRLEVKSRSGNFMVSVDSKIEVMNITNNVFTIRRATYTLRMVQLPYNNYFSTLRNKLMWGVDIRNYPGN